MEWRPFYHNDSSLLSTGDTVECATGRLLHIDCIHLKATASDTVGNRDILVQAKDSDGDVMAQVRGGAVYAASAVRYFQFATNSPDKTSFVDTDFICNPLPDIILTPGLKWVVIEDTQIDPGSDLFEIQMFGEIAGYED